MTTRSDVPDVSPSPNAATEPMAEPIMVEDGAQLSLKVRTLDQKTYPITICAAASVPQLKELVAIETGITLARQRLIYRGRVLKNDQTLASYSLEDGHVLHLVVRAVPPPPTTDATSNESQERTATLDMDRNAATHLDTMNDIDALNARLDEFQRSTLRSRSRSRQRQRRTNSTPPPPRDNDEPDPSMGRSGVTQPGHVLMGATITVPEGADVTMPFLSSMIANLVTQVNGNGAGVEIGGMATGTSAGGQRHMASPREVVGGATAAEVQAASARALRHHHRNRNGSGRQRTARRSSSGVERQAALRARTGLRLESVRATLDDASLDFPSDLTALPQGDNNTAMSEFQQQVEMLLTLLERFGPRLRLLPAALAQRDLLSERAAAALVESSAVTTDLASALSRSSTETSAAPTGVSSASIALSADFNTALAEPTTTLAELSTALTEPSTALTEPSTVSVESSTASAGPSAASAGFDPAVTQLVTASIGPTAIPTELVTSTSDSAAATGTTLSGRQIIRTIEALQTIGESTELLARMARHAFVRQSMQLGEPISRRGDAAATGTTASDRMQARFHAGAPAIHSAHADNRMQATLDAMQAPRTATQGTPDMRPRMRVARISAGNLLGERSSAALRTARATLAGQSGSTSSFPIDLTESSGGAVPQVSGVVAPALNSEPTTRAEVVLSNNNGPLPPTGAHFSISGMGLPLASSVVFPFSLAAGLGGSHATTTWNLADFVSRLTSELPISTLYGVMAGDATHLHHMLAHIGFALFSGVDVPRVTRPSIRTWAQDLLGELCRLSRLNALPIDVLDQVDGTSERSSALGNELLRVVEPFIPDLVDLLVRATSASRATAFGMSSATFLRTMTQQIVRQLRSYARGNSLESEAESDERLKRLLRGLLVWLGINQHMAHFVVDSLLCWIEEGNTGSRRGRTRRREEASSDADSIATKRQRE